MTDSPDHVCDHTGAKFTCTEYNYPYQVWDKMDCCGKEDFVRYRIYPYGRSDQPLTTLCHSCWLNHHKRCDKSSVWRTSTTQVYVIHKPTALFNKNPHNKR